MTNYEMLINRNAVVSAFGDEFAKEWYDGPSYHWRSSPFACGTCDNSRFYNAARKMHETWLAAWKCHKASKDESYKNVTFDFGCWLFKYADTALLIPVGSTVSIKDGRMGIVIPGALSGNYSLENVRVEVASGFVDVSPKDVHMSNIPNSLMELAKSLALKELKKECPILKGE